MVGCRVLFKNHLTRHRYELEIFACMPNALPLAVSHPRLQSGARTRRRFNIIDERRRDEISITGRERWKRKWRNRRARALGNRALRGKRAWLFCRILRLVSCLFLIGGTNRRFSYHHTRFLAFSRRSLCRNARRLIIFLKIRPSLYGYHRPREIIYAITRAKVYVL